MQNKTQQPPRSQSSPQGASSGSSQGSRQSSRRPPARYSNVQSRRPFRRPPRREDTANTVPSNEQSLAENTVKVVPESVVGHTSEKIIHKRQPKTAEVLNIADVKIAVKHIQKKRLAERSITISVEPAKEVNSKRAITFPMLHAARVRRSLAERTMRLEVQFGGEIVGTPAPSIITNKKEPLKHVPAPIHARDPGKQAKPDELLTLPEPAITEILEAPIDARSEGSERGKRDGRNERGGRERSGRTGRDGRMDNRDARTPFQRRTPEDATDVPQERSQERLDIMSPPPNPRREQRRVIEITPLELPPIFQVKTMPAHRIDPASIVVLASLEHFVTSVEVFLRDHALLTHGVTLVCAVSGGADSIVLLDILSVVAQRHELTIVVAHCNHRLRGKASATDELFVKDAAKRYGFAFYAGTVDVRAVAEEQRMGIEAAARQVRYQFLEFVAYKAKADAVATAHILNDSVETFLMNLMRGSGLTGLSGIGTTRPFGQMSSLVRPLLGFKKDDVMMYCNERGLVWREDETNSLLLYTRNKVRHDLIPKLESEYSPAIMDVLHRTSQLMREADVAISSIVERVLPSVVEEVHNPTWLLLRVEGFIPHSAFLQAEILHRALNKHFNLQPLSQDALERILKLLRSEIGAKADVSKQFYAVRDRDHIIVAPKAPVHNINVRVEKNNAYDFGGWKLILREVDRKQVRFTGDPAVEFVDSALLPYRMTLRTWQAGDVFQPLGMKGTMNVSDFLTNGKISFMSRQNVLVLTTSENIVCVCGLRVSEKFRIADETQKVLRIEFRPAK